MSKVRDVRSGSVLADAIQTLKAPEAYSPAVLRRSIALVNGARMRTKELRAHFGELPHLQLAAGRVALAELSESTQEAASAPWLAATAAITQKFLKDGSALACDAALDGWQAPGRAVLTSVGVSTMLRQVDAPPQRLSRMVAQPLAATLGLAAINHAARDDPHESFARTAEILQIAAVQKTLAEARRPFVCIVSPADAALPVEALSLEDGAAILLQSTTMLGEYQRATPLTNERDNRPKIIARQSVRLLQRTLFAVTPDLAAILCEVEVDVVPHAETFAPLAGLAQEFVEAASPQDFVPLATMLQASQTWTAIKMPEA